MAVLLAVAAVIVAIVGGRAALVGDSGSDTWQAAIREDVKRSAGIVEDARFLYSEEVPLALQVEQRTARSRELRRAARSESGDVQDILEGRAQAQKEVIEPIDSSNELASNPRYPLAEDGVARRLADARAKNPDLVRLDPDATESRGIVAHTPLDVADREHRDRRARLPRGRPGRGLSLLAPATAPGGLRVRGNRPGGGDRGRGGVPMIRGGA